MANDYVIEDFDLQELPGSNEVTSDFDVGFRWGRFTAGMMRDDDCSGRKKRRLGSDPLENNAKASPVVADDRF